MLSSKWKLWMGILFLLSLGLLASCQLPLPGADAPTPFVTITSAIDLPTDEPDSSPSGVIGGH